MHHPEFDEPALREALRRACPPEKAPAHLRASIATMLERAAATGTTGEPMKLTPSADQRGYWHLGARRVAAAAAIVGLGLGVGLFMLTDPNGVTPGSAVAVNDTPTLAVQSALVRHDQLYNSMSAGGDGWRRTLASVPQVREELRAHAPMPIPSVDLSSLGWQLVGAQSCEVGAACAAQIFYTRGRQTLSVFVLPPGESAEIQRGCGQTKSHITAARNAAGATLLFVARCPTGSLSREEVEQLAAFAASR